MLQIKVFVDDNQIDELTIVNTGHKEFGQHLYRVKKPEKYNKYPIYHDRNEGWTILVEKVLKAINQKISEPIVESAVPLSEQDEVNKSNALRGIRTKAGLDYTTHNIRRHKNAFTDYTTQEQGGREFKIGDRVKLPFDETGTITKIETEKLDFFPYKVRIRKCVFNKTNQVLEFKKEQLRIEDE